MAFVGPHPELQHLNLLRLSRSTVVRLQTHFSVEQLERVVTGCFVRVLLETAEGGEQLYRVARVSGTTIGEEYSGYSFSDEKTTVHLNLDVPQALGHSTSQIQLNSISNSDFLREEFEQWLPLAAEEAKLPTFEEMQAKARELRPSLAEAGCQPVSALLRPDSFLPGGGLMAAPGGGAAEKPTTRRSNDQKKRKLPGGADADDSSREVKELRAEVAALKGELSKRKEHPCDLTTMQMDDLNRLEDGVNQYLKAIQDRKREMLQCKICMDKEISVVLLPCKHQALCKGCAFKVKNCPLCRATIVDRIMPHKW